MLEVVETVSVESVERDDAVDAVEAGAEEEGAGDGDAELRGDRDDKESMESSDD